MTATDIELQRAVSSVLGEVSHRTSVADLQLRLGRSGVVGHRRIVEQLAGFARDSRVINDEHSRVLLARLIVASLPDSLACLQQLLTATHVDGCTAELQFSLFVALADLSDRQAPKSEEMLLRMIHTYLLSVASSSADAPWMAGDLLGEHWRTTDSLAVLMDAAQRAEHSAGREGAIHGLSHALAGADKLTQWKIVEVLRYVAEHDVDHVLRRYADSVICELRGI